MTSRVFSGDLEYGRGRRHDSSSSRESSPSPGRKRKRSFSPGSDDGEPDIPPIADDDTPPPPERPLIRQAVAFTGATTALPNSSLYQAMLPETTANTIFLPGQAPVPPKKTKRKKKNDLYKEQAGRFRLDIAYDSTPSAAPPVQQGPGPYASAFRGYSQRPSARSESPAVVEPIRYPSTSASTVRGSTSPAPTMPGEGMSRTRSTAPSRNKAVASQNRMPPVQTETPPQVRISSSSHLATPATDAISPTFPSSLPSRARGNYYRQDYETGLPLGHQSDPSHIDIPMFPHFDTDPQPIVTSDTVPPFPPSGAHTSNAPEGTNVVAKTHAQNARLVTILAQDIRSGTPDHQLIEVHIPIRPADNARDGYWANARELLEQWQHGPARVDGPARVFTLRGQYRQVLLRVSATNEDAYISGNIVLNQDRAVHVVIENLPTPGAPPPPPTHVLQDSFPNPRPTEVVRLASTPRLISNHQPSPPRRIEPSGLRNHHSSDDDYDDPTPDSRNAQTSSPRDGAGQDVAIIDGPTSSGSHPPFPGPSGRPANANVAGPFRAQSETEIQAPSRRSRRGYESPCSGDEPEKVESAILKAVDNLIQKDDNWKGLFRLKAGAETASNMVGRYRFVQGLIDKYVGQPVPFRSTSDYVIEEKHIIGALMIEDPEGKFASNCKKTLDLLKLYGEGGERYEDAEVIKLMKEKEVAYNAKPIKRLLRLLQDIDRKWTQDHPAS